MRFDTLTEIWHIYREFIELGIRVAKSAIFPCNWTTFKLLSGCFLFVRYRWKDSVRPLSFLKKKLCVMHMKVLKNMFCG